MMHQSVNADKMVVLSVIRNRHKVVNRSPVFTVIHVTCSKLICSSYSNHRTIVHDYPSRQTVMSTQGQILKSKMDSFDLALCLHLNNEQYYGTDMYIWKWQEDKEEDVRSYWMTLRTGEDTLI